MLTAHNPIIKRHQFLGSDQRDGFTLIELLIVIAIISVLATLLVVVIAMVREQAQQIACASHLRQCGVTLFAHAADYHGKLPPGHVYGPMPATGDGTTRSYWDTMSNFYDGDSPFVCPTYAGLVRSGAIIPPDQAKVIGIRVGDMRPFTYSYFVGDSKTLYVGDDIAKPPGTVNRNSNGIPITMRTRQHVGNLSVTSVLMSDQLYAGGSNRWWCDAVPYNLGLNGDLPVTASFFGNHGRKLSKPISFSNLARQNDDNQGNYASMALRFSSEEDRSAGGNTLLGDGSVHWKRMTACQANPNIVGLGNTVKPSAVGLYSYAEFIYVYDGTW